MLLCGNLKVKTFEVKKTSKVKADPYITFIIIT